MSDIEIQECEYPTTPGLYWVSGVDWREDTYIGIAYYDGYVLRDLANEWHFVSPPNVPDEYDESKLYSCEPLTVAPTELLDQMRAACDGVALCQAANTLLDWADDHTPDAKETSE